MENNVFEKQTKIKDNKQWLSLRNIKVLKIILLVSIVVIGLGNAIYQTNLENEARRTVEALYAGIVEDNAEYEYTYQSYNEDGSLFLDVLLQRDENLNYYVQLKNNDFGIIEAYIIDNNVSIPSLSSEATFDISNLPEYAIEENEFGYIFDEYDDLIENDYENETIKRKGGSIEHAVKNYDDDEQLMGEEVFNFPNNQLAVDFKFETYDSKEDSWNESITLKDISIIELNANE